MKGSAAPAALSIVLITYNRADYLRKTLEALAASPFRTHPITLLDNCSTDDTAAVAQSFAAVLPNYRVVRHTINIGGDPNILRALEYSCGSYTWVMGDDDDFNWEVAPEVLALCGAAQVDLINVWMPDEHGVQRGTVLGVRDTALRHRRFFFNHSFITGVIFRTDLISPEILEAGYTRLDGHYPQLALSAHALERNGSMFITSKPIVRRGGDSIRRFGTGHRNTILWYSWWCKACQVINDPAVRAVAMDDGFHQRGDFYMYLIQAVWESRAIGNMLHLHAFLSLTSSQPKWRLLFCLLLLPLYAVPKSLAARIEGVRRWVWGAPRPV